MNGRPHRESSQSEKETEARRLLRLREGDIERGVPVTPRVGRIRFEEAAADVINDYRTNGKRSLDDVERRIEKHLKPVFGRRRMATITTADVRVLRRSTSGHDAGVQTVEARRSSEDAAGVKWRNQSRTHRAQAHVQLGNSGGEAPYKPHIPMLHEDNVRAGFFEREQFEAIRSRLPEAVQGIVTFACHHRVADGQRNPAVAVEAG